MADSDDDDEYYTVPLKDQRYFGAGIKRKRVNFVASTTTESTFPSQNPSNSGLSASERYLSIVLPKSASEPPSTQPQDMTKTCDICKINYTGHEAKHACSLAHQIAIPHTHPPSALDRSRTGLTILQSYGFDPDERRGLGARREGILHPVKAKEKRDTLGLGVNLHDEDARPKKKQKEKSKPVQKLDAGKVRQLELDNKKKDERLRRMFYATEDIDRYLGPG